MARRFRSFRFQMIFLLTLSMLCSGILTYALYKMLQQYYTANVLAEDPLARFRYMIGNIGDLNFFLILFIPLALVFFYLFTKPYARYFREISQQIRQLAEGNFSSRIIIPSKDEFGDIAADLNLASGKLQQAVERGDFAENSKDQLVLNLAHDLRTPLTSVLGYLDYVLKDEELTAKQVRHYTSIAYTKSRRLERLIDELFELTRMNYGMLKIDSSPLDLSELLTQLHEELYPLLDNNGLTARLELAPVMEILGDGELLARVFENLLTNAVRYGKDGQYVDISCNAEDGQAVVRVTNYGGSILPADLPYVFDMFYTGDRARSHQEGSTGLGLFIAKNIVEQHKGTISVNSDPVRTSFEVRLPLER
ncbi:MULTISPECIES: HAMP domain-containing sensor histidine kinase [unclassified Paenibacillus]|uniref:sensor histidine kinase n=1 Tax=unclassified Paenibacillus TaxID=185978 RepID=UPI0024052E2C|nr:MULTISPECIES: HAMP domain-containing sensor histidine kinase [unclassified Paenibacillus]MDF9845079.1 two-component system sensor histidine kinase VanS [Paenibacillus sp. PastF-2]MDF9851690.1 two-component system sensor histidine kinase VanS [Paenibacillus sp. PastM-2]MDF9858274.1 two-component system sensor histidine kinase VanS [Paenibacillus sp. PastF-1]MDH6483538.1 two-component system sensor histidine kinase VanS [Paenibacillus sp. PastH-2]MDH6510938.1 two-component system sensor histi